MVASHCHKQITIPLRNDLFMVVTDVCRACNKSKRVELVEAEVLRKK